MKIVKLHHGRGWYRIGACVGCALLFGVLTPLPGVVVGAASARAAVPTAITNPSDVLPTPVPVSTTSATPTAAPVGGADDPTQTPQPTRTPRPTATATPLANARPDTCEPNNSREQVCALSMDSVSGPFTFLPVPDTDWYAVDLGQPNGLATEITVRVSGSADVITTLTRADGTPLGTISSPAISLTLQGDVGGSVVFQVENRSPDDADGASYTLEVRRVLPPPPVLAPEVVALRNLKPDPLENDWDARTAAPIGIGFVYTLNFVCPDPRPDACGGGDHDYLQVPVKANTTYVMATFDLGPGVDTALDLFWGSEDVPIATNDDAGPIGFASLLRWRAPADGVAILRVAPRTGGVTPLVFDAQASTYHLAVALDGSDLAQQIQARVVAQTQRPTPTPRPSAPAPDVGGGGNGRIPAASVPAAPIAPAPAPAAPTTLPATDLRPGQALVIAPETALRAAPDAKADPLDILTADTVVTLTGQGQGIWVRVETSAGVLPGWVDSRALRRIQAASTGTPTVTAPLTTTTTTSQTNRTPVPTPRSGPARVTRLEDAPPPAAPTPLPRAALTVHVTLRAAPATSSTTTTRTPGRPLTGVRVQLVNAFGDLLAEGLTDSNGQISLTRDVEAGTAVRVRVPSAGLEVTVERVQPTLELDLPVPPATPTGATP